MTRGRKPTNPLPDCAFFCYLHTHYLSTNDASVVELSDDGKKVRCKICHASHGQSNGWIMKDSFPGHLKSNAHASCVLDQENREAIKRAHELSIQEEREIEERMDFVMLPSRPGSSIQATARIPKQSIEEREMWENYACCDEIFDAGIDDSSAAAEERKRLEREANDYDLWHGADFLPEEGSNDSQLLLDELEQDDILTEVLQNACTCSIQICPYNSMHTLLLDRLKSS